MTMRSCGYLLPSPRTPAILPPCHLPHFLDLGYKDPTATPETTVATPFPTSQLRLRLRLHLRPTFASLQNPIPSSSIPPEQFSVLFVCLGNICRSPTAEGVFRSLVRKRGLDSHFVVDSAGTIGYHEGEKADSRMRAAAKARGIEVTSISRKIRPSDFRDFDLILAMDLQNRDDILDAYERWSEKESLPKDAPKKVKMICSYCKHHTEMQVPDPYYGGPQGFEKVKMICSYCKHHTEMQVPDPYYGGPQGFEKVLDLLEDACGSLLELLAGKV